MYARTSGGGASLIRVAMTAGAIALTKMLHHPLLLVAIHCYAPYYSIGEKLEGVISWSDPP